jgi:hypothetical protein
MLTRVRAFRTIMAFALVSLLGCEASHPPLHNDPVPPTTASPSFNGGAVPLVTVAGLTVGDHHNAAMAAAYKAFARSGAGHLSSAGACQMGRNAVTRHLRDVGVNVSREFERLLDAGFDGAGCGRSGPRPDSRFGTASYSYTDFATTVENSGFSAAAKDYLYQIYNTATSDLATSEIQTQIGSIQNQANAGLAWNEAEIVIATASVAASSAEYWEANWDSWVAAFSPDIYMTSLPRGERVVIQRRGWWKSVVGGDVGGAVGGAIAGSFAGGVGAGPGALAGGVGGSVGAAVIEALHLL